MGFKFEVCSWFIGEGQTEYDYHFVWGGDTLEEALDVAQKEKDKGRDCVKIEWR